MEAPFFILKLLKIWFSTCSWREMEEQIDFIWTAERPQSPTAFIERFFGGRKQRQRLRIQPSEEVTMLQLRQGGEMAPVISCYCMVFQLSLERSASNYWVSQNCFNNSCCFFLWKPWWATVVCWLHEFSWHCSATQRLVPFLVVPVLTAHAVSAWAEGCSCPLPCVFNWSSWWAVEVTRTIL